MSQCPTDSYATRVQRGTLYSSSRGIAVISATDARTELDVYSTGQVDTRIIAASLAQTNQANISNTAAAASLAAETSRATTAEAGLHTSLTAETSRATSAESVISAAVTAETSRATAAESGLRTSLTAETTRATAAELALTSTFSSYLPLAGGTMSAPINMASHAITNLPSPSNASDAVCKSYVDNISAGLTAHPSVRAYVASTAGYTYVNGVAGVGATLTVVNSASTPLVFDGYTPLVGERVLVNSPTNLHANGVYTLTTSRVSGNTCVFTRAEYFDGDPLTEIHPGAMFYVAAGTVYANPSFVQVSPIPATMGVSPVQYTQFSALPIIVNGPNVNIVGNQIGVTPTLTNIAAVQLASTPSAGTVTLQQSPASSTYTVSLPAAAPTANAMLKYDGTNYAWSALQAGANIGVSGNIIALNAALSGINSVALQSADTSAGVVTLSKAPGTTSYAIALPPAAPATGNVLMCSGSGTYSWSAPVQAGANVGVSGNTIALNAALSGINSVALRNTDASAGVVTVSKSSGAASYALSLPAAAPSANTALVYDGSNYVWGAAANGSSAGTYAGGYLMATYQTPNNITTTAINQPFPFTDIVSPSGSAPMITVNSPITKFTLAPGYTYKCTAQMGFNNGSGDFKTQWSNVTASVPGTLFGTKGNLNSAVPRGILATGYITNNTAGNIVIALIVTSGTGIISGNDYPWATIEVVSNNTISQFIGATQNTNGIVGYIPAPPAGTQNSYLRGDGTWQQANNAPTAASYVFAVAPSVQTPTAAYTIVWPTTGNITIAGNMIAAYDATTWSLQPGATYRVMVGYGAGYMNTNTGGSFQININGGQAPYSNNGSAMPANGNWTSNNTTLAYVAVPTTPSLLTVVWTGVTANDGLGAGGAIISTATQTGVWLSIEQVSNNSVIAAFTGATPSTDGVVGYIPAPPAGTQNSYLRGDGTWQQANNAPTAAILMHATYVGPVNTPIPTADGTAFAFNTVAFSTGTTGVVSPSPSPTNIATFVLAAGYTYKCTAQIGFNNTSSGSSCIYQWSTVPYEAGTSTLFGVVGAMNNTAPRSPTAIGYIAVSTATTISLIVLSGAGSIHTGGPGAGAILSPWATIEVVSNNNTITAFTGATPSTNGVVGYIPAPPAGTQNSYLRGDGTWQQANNAPTAAQYLMVGLTQPANTGTAVNASINFDTPMGSLGNMITQPTMNTFLLAAGASYKLRACVINSGNVQFAWYNITTGAFIGINGVSFNSTGVIVCAPGTADGFITTSVNATVCVRCTFSSGAISGQTPNGVYPYSNYAWAIIEQVNNNNTITAFTGATSSTAGIIGYIPAPPAGTQNSYLRGDGSWQPTTFPGQITWSATATTPAGWLVCNGASYLVSAYPGLFAAISTLYGVGTDTTGGTTFSVPDMRGQFIRGADSGAGIDVGRTLGTKQTDTIQNITGAYTGSATIANAGTNGTGAIYTTGDYQGAGGYNGGGNGANYQRILMDASRSVRTSTETRPKNIALIALIKT